MFDVPIIAYFRHIAATHSQLVNMNTKWFARSEISDCIPFISMYQPIVDGANYFYSFARIPSAEIYPTNNRMNDR